MGGRRRSRRASTRHSTTAPSAAPATSTTPGRREGTGTVAPGIPPAQSAVCSSHHSSGLVNRISRCDAPGHKGASAAAAVPATVMGGIAAVWQPHPAPPGGHDPPWTAEASAQRPTSTPLQWMSGNAVGCLRRVPSWRHCFPPSRSSMFPAHLPDASHPLDVRCQLTGSMSATSQGRTSEPPGYGLMAHVAAVSPVPDSPAAARWSIVVSKRRVLASVIPSCEFIPSPRGVAPSRREDVAVAS